VDEPVHGALSALTRSLRAVAAALVAAVTEVVAPAVARVAAGVATRVATRTQTLSGGGLSEGRPLRGQATRGRAGSLPRAARVVQGLRRIAARRTPRLALALFEPTPAELGPLGESLAAQHLARSGLCVLGRNVLRPESELDLVATRGSVLVAVEVKTSRVFLDQPLGALPHRPAERVDARRRERLARAAAGLARASGRVARVDVVEVWIAGPRRRPSLAWHPGRAAEEVPRA